MADSSDEERGTKNAKSRLVYRPSHSLFVRNLSPEVNEQILRTVFDQDAIEKISFRAFPNSNTQFFAQIDFASSKGVTEGSRLSGVPILGVPCEVGVVDPIISEGHKRAAAASSSADAAAGSAEPEAPSVEEVNKRITEAAEDQRMRTIHVAGLPASTTREKLERLCLKFGDVERLMTETDAKGKLFGLVEFKDRGPAHIAKTQRTFTVDGCLLTITEAKSMVEESSFMEQTVQFQAPIVDAMAMKNVLYQQMDLRGKLDKVREAAMSIARKEDEKEEDAEALGPLALAAAKVRAKEMEEKAKEKAEKRASKAEKRAEKFKKKQAKKEKKLEKKKKKKLKKKKRKEAEAAEAEEEDEEEDDALDVSESDGGPVDLESEVELMGGTELVMLPSCSSSASSESTDREERIADAIARRRKQRVCLANLIGDWHHVVTAGETPGMWSVSEDGVMSFNTRQLKLDKWGLVQETNGDKMALFCKGQRVAGWELDLNKSTVDRLIWKKAGEIDAHWLRKGAKTSKGKGKAKAKTGSMR